MVLASSVFRIWQKRKGTVVLVLTAAVAVFVLAEGKQG